MDLDLQFKDRAYAAERDVVPAQLEHLHHVPVVEDLAGGEERAVVDLRARGDRGCEVEDGPVGSRKVREIAVSDGLTLGKVYAGALGERLVLSENYLHRETVATARIASSRRRSGRESEVYIFCPRATKGRTVSVE